MSVTKDVRTFTTDRVILSSPKPFKEVIATLDKELGRDKAENVLWPLLANAKSHEEVVQGLNTLMDSGKREFVFFALMRHSNWLGHYHGRKFPETYSYTFGNPLLAQDFMPKDAILGIYAPARAIVQEIEGGGTRILYDSAATWYRENTSDELKATTEFIAAKMEAFFTKVLS